LIFSFGSLTPSANIVHYDTLVEQLANVVTKRCKLSPEANHSGVIINTCGWIKGDGYACLVNAAEKFEVDVVVVMDHERLFNELQRDLPTFVRIVHQPKSGGVEDRSREMRVASRKSAIDKYFYGTRSLQYRPHSFELRFEEVIIVKVGTEELPDSCLPYGMKPEDHRTKVVTVRPTLHLAHRVVALSGCANPDQEVLSSNVLGFLTIQSVDVEKRVITVLSPQPSPLPAKILILSEVTFVDDNFH